MTNEGTHRRGPQDSTRRRTGSRRPGTGRNPGRGAVRNSARQQSPQHAARLERRRAARAGVSFDITYPPQLPVSEHRDEIAEAIVEPGTGEEPATDETNTSGPMLNWVMKSSACE